MKLKASIFLLVAAGILAIGWVRWNQLNSKAPSPVVTAASPMVSPTELPSQSPPKKESGLHEAYCNNAHTATCKGAWPSRDPTGIVRADVTGEVRALRYMRNLIRENPSWTSEQVQERLAEIIYSEKRRQRVQEGFLWVITAFKKFINEQPESAFSLEEKQAIVERLSRLTLELPPPASVYADAADLITKNTVYYERTPSDELRLRMGGAYLLSTTSWYNIVFTFSHEIAHAIDPCEAKQAGIFPAAYQGLVDCFVEGGWVSAERSSCGPDEQISEVFADWVAAELVGRAIAENSHNYSAEQKTKAAINATRDLCEQAPAADLISLKFHQSPEFRVGTIMGENPMVREALSCPPRHKASYCHFRAANKQASLQGAQK